MSIYVVDLDGTLCHTESNPDGHGMKYYEAIPYPCLLYTSDAADE